jgi:hypothetical protein
MFNVRVCAQRDSRGMGSQVAGDLPLLLGPTLCLQQHPDCTINDLLSCT